MEEKTYPFPEFDVSGMLNDLLEKKIIKLPECKQPEEMGHTIPTIQSTANTIKL